MTSRELVVRAVRFEGPERVPYALPGQFGTDFLPVGAEVDPAHAPRINSETERVDEFGCVWTKLAQDKTMGQVTGHPLSDFTLLDGFSFPSYAAPAQYEKTRQIIEQNTAEKFVLANVPLSLIHRLEYLRGHQSAWTDPYEHPDELHTLLGRLADIAVESVDRFAEIGADGIISCDDWGLQDRPMVSPELFAEFWQPYYHRVYHRAHEQGLLTFLHSCGHIMDLLPHFIDAELDVIQMDQQENMGVDSLAERFGGKLCFWCPVDIQNTMVRGSVEEVRVYARKLIDRLGSYQGGFIGTWYASPDAVQHSQEKIDAMCEEFVQYGGWCYQDAIED